MSHAEFEENIQEEEAFKQLFVVSEGGVLIYHKTFIGESASPEILAGFFSALSSFIKETYGLEINELNVSKYKLYFFKVGEEITVVILSGDSSSVEDVKPLVESIYSEINQIIKNRKLSLVNINEFKERLDKIILKTLSERRERHQGEGFNFDFYPYLESILKDGSMDLIKAIFIDGKIAIVGEKEKVKEVIYFIRKMVGDTRKLRYMDYIQDKISGDVVGLPISMIDRIPENYLIIDLYNSKIKSKHRCEYCQIIYSKISRLPFEEKINIIRNILSKLDEQKNKLSQILAEGSVEKAETYLNSIEHGFRELLLDYLISSNSLLKFIRECRRHIPVDVILNLDKRLAYINAEILMLGELPFIDEIKLIQQVYEEVKNYLGTGKILELSKLLTSLIR